MPPRNTNDFLRELDTKINGRPDALELKSALAPFAARLARAEQEGKSKEVAAILGEMQGALQRALSKPDDPDNTPPDAPIDPFTESAINALSIGPWVIEQHRKRLTTMGYFKFTPCESIDGNVYSPPDADLIWQSISRSEIDVIKTFKKPLLIMTPIGVPMRDLVTLFASKKGAMRKNNTPSNWWNKENEESQDFGLDMRGDMVYQPFAFDPENHNGKTKYELLEDPLNACKGWQVLVVEGANEISNKDMDANATLFFEQQSRLVGLTPEDDIMLQAEGLRRGEPFESDGSDYKWLTGAYIKSLNKVPHSFWYPSGAKIKYFANTPGYSDRFLGSRRAIRIL